MMKKVLIGLLAITSTSVFANDVTCSASLKMNGKTTTLVMPEKKYEPGAFESEIAPFTFFVKPAKDKSHLYVNVSSKIGQQNVGMGGATIAYPTKNDSYYSAVLPTYLENGSFYASVVLSLTCSLNDLTQIKVHFENS